MFSSIGRAAVRRVTAGHRSTNRAVSGIRRVEAPHTKSTALHQIHSRLPAHRTYSTATATATASKTAPKQSATAKTSKAKPTTKKTAAKKPPKQPVTTLAKKPKKKVVSKAKPKPKGLTVKQKEKLERSKQKEKAAKRASKEKEKAALLKTKEKAKAVSQKAKAAVAERKIIMRELKATALETPGKKPDNKWTVFVTQRLAGVVGKNPSENIKAVAAQYKLLSAEEIENLSNIAAQNSAANKVAYTQWVESHTPDQISKANQARTTLRKKSLYYPKIQDSRQPTRPTSPFFQFYTEQHLTGDFVGSKVAETAKSLSLVWKSMSETERKPYIDAFESDKRRYEEEYKTVFHRDLPTPPKRSA